MVKADFDDHRRVLQAFAGRMHEVCDDIRITSDRGRQTALAQQFDVNPKAARRWLLGLGFPELAMAIRIANRAQVSVVWLLQGLGPKRPQKKTPPKRG